MGLLQSVHNSTKLLALCLQKGAAFPAHTCYCLCVCVYDTHNEMLLLAVKRTWHWK